MRLKRGLKPTPVTLCLQLWKGVQNSDQYPHQAGCFLPAAGLIGQHDGTVVPVVAGPLAGWVAVVEWGGLPEQQRVMIQQEDVLHLASHDNLNKSCG